MTRYIRGSRLELAVSAIVAAAVILVVMTAASAFLPVLGHPFALVLAAGIGVLSVLQVRARQR